MHSGKSIHVEPKKRKLDPTSHQPRSYSEPVLESHLDLLKQGTFSDVTFIVGEAEERIQCHQLFLKARSPVFEAMFSERWNHDIHKEITLEDVKPKAFKLFLQFIYADILAANVPEALELLQLAHIYQVQLLVDKCEKLLESQVTLEHALAVFQAARKYGKIQLMDKVGDLWAKSLSKMQALPSFSQLDKETLVYIMRRNDLKMKEVDIFRLALQWAGNQTDVTVTESLKDIVPLIRFPTMTLNVFTTTVVPTKVLSPDTVIELFTYFGTDDDEAKESLARTLGFSSEQRQPNNAIVSVALYPADILNNGTTCQLFQKLQECLQFCNHTDSARYPGVAPQVPVFSLGNAIIPVLNSTRSNEAIQGIGLRGFRFYCPAESNMIASLGAAATSFKKFKILVKSRDCPDNQVDFYSNRDYKELLSLPSVQGEEGKITDVKFDAAIPLKEDTVYCVTIEEMTTTQVYGSFQSYNAKDFGTGPSSTVAVNIDNRHQATLAVRRNQLCGFKEVNHPHTAGDLQMHIIYNHKNERKFSCQFPNRNFRGKTIKCVRRHLITHNEDRPFFCDFEGCSYRTKTKGPLKTHKIGMHSGGFKPFACSVCNYHTIFKSALRRHLLSHADIKSVKCDFAGCSYSCKTKTVLRSHRLYHHTIRKFKCDYASCSYSAPRPFMLEVHKKVVHYDKAYKCFSYSYQAATSERLEAHVQCCHRTSHCIPCPSKGCTFQAKHQQSLKRHLQYHKADLVCSVEGCSYVGSSSYGWKRHMQLHDPTHRPFQCGLCSQNFSKNFLLSNHLRSHLQEKPFKCHISGHGAVSQQGRTKHMRTKHSDVIPQFVVHNDESVCDHCGVHFGNVTSLALHTLMHKTAVVLLPRLQIKSERIKCK